MNNPTQKPTFAFSMPRLMLHIEGFVIFAMCIALYIYLGGNGWLFVVLLLSPDLSAVGYLINPVQGARLYNLFHTYSLPLILGVVSLWVAWQMGLLLALIWGAHIGMDRAVGYGLKYPSAFKETHFSRL